MTEREIGLKKKKKKEMKFVGEREELSEKEGFWVKTE